MKSIRITSAKTRKGVITWLKKLAVGNDYCINYIDERAVAVYVHKHTGVIHGFDNLDGQYVNVLAFRAQFQKAA